MKPPTISQYNSWSLKDRIWWVEFETGGLCKTMIRAKGYFPFIIYDKENVGIVYQVDKSGQITEATAMTVKEALDRLERFKNASKAMMATN